MFFTLNNILSANKTCFKSQELFTLLVHPAPVFEDLLGLNRIVLDQVTWLNYIVANPLTSLFVRLEYLQFINIKTAILKYSYFHIIIAAMHSM